MLPPVGRRPSGGSLIGEFLGARPAIRGLTSAPWLAGTGSGGITITSQEQATYANYIYYFEIGQGSWSRSLGSRVTNWQAFWSDQTGLKNRFLVLSMALVSKFLGRSRITSHPMGLPEKGELRVVTNRVRITKLGIPLYLLQEKYILNPDCRQAWVQSQERCGPLPVLFNSSNQHPAEILDGGMRSICYIPLLGTDWEGHYTVREDRSHIDSILSCSWAEATERIDRVA